MLQEIIDWVVYSALGLNPESRIAESLNFLGIPLRTGWVYVLVVSVRDRGPRARHGHF